MVKDRKNKEKKNEVNGFVSIRRAAVMLRENKVGDQLRLLNALRDGDLLAFCRFPSGQASDYDVPRAYWQSIHDKDFKVSFKNDGRWRGREHMIPGAWLASREADALLKTLAAVSKKLRDGSISEADLRALPQKLTNWAAKAESPMALHDMLISRVQALESARTTEFGAYISEKELQTYMESTRPELKKKHAGGRRPITGSEYFWLEILARYKSRDLPSTRKELQMEMMEWSKKNKDFMSSESWIEKRVAEIFDRLSEEKNK
ncbi:hypothetical protein [Azospirillum ramasamyi]|uniref:hypothetical protein n=1 Tax=Azospirillum ramasamyi TaxID=682998 RepID=UPI0013A6A78F|nr:hypothetical protein [Azospirillum ramasamyi]